MERGGSLYEEVAASTNEGASLTASAAVIPSRGDGEGPRAASSVSNIPL